VENSPIFLYQKIEKKKKKNPWSQYMLVLEAQQKALFSQGKY
jgi:predicted transcriptional regulator